jgi:HD superfamily phosphodiesterase
MSLFTKLFHYVLLASEKYGVDESHGVKHSMEVLNYANQIYLSELPKNLILESQENIIYASAVIHDMCDKKYMNEKKGVREIGEFLEEHMDPIEANIVQQIVSTMSYSKVKKDGYPFMGPYQRAYHIVREADLLAAYDFDRSMIYHLHHSDSDIHKAFENANDLFENRVLKHNDHGLFITDYSKSLSMTLHSQALQRIGAWRRILT